METQAYEAVAARRGYEKVRVRNITHETGTPVRMNNGLVKTLPNGETPKDEKGNPVFSASGAGADGLAERRIFFEANNQRFGKVLDGIPPGGVAEVFLTPMMKRWLDSKCMERVHSQPDSQAQYDAQCSLLQHEPNFNRGEDRTQANEMAVLRAKLEEQAKMIAALQTAPKGK